MPIVYCPVCKARIDKAKGVTDKIAFLICARNNHPGNEKPKPVNESTVESELKDDKRAIQPGRNKTTANGKDKGRETIHTESELSGFTRKRINRLRSKRESAKD